MLSILGIINVVLIIYAIYLIITPLDTLRDNIKNFFEKIF